MASLNRVFLIGNLTRTPELRYTPSGTAVADLRLAVNRNYTTQGGEKREETCFLTCVVWGNADDALKVAWNQLCWACASAGGGSIATPDGVLSATDFAPFVGLSPS